MMHGHTYIKFFVFINLFLKNPFFKTKAKGGCFDNCVGVLVIRVLVFTVFLCMFRLCIFILTSY